MCVSEANSFHGSLADAKSYVLVPRNLQPPMLKLFRYDGWPPVVFARNKRLFALFREVNRSHYSTSAAEGFFNICP